MLGPDRECLKTKELFIVKSIIDNKSLRFEHFQNQWG